MKSFAVGSYHTTGWGGGAEEFDVCSVLLQSLAKLGIYILRCLNRCPSITT